ncbi:hypothetical protein Leryth_027646 [Lithospermum erythrorhizon]|nr:hypothetical protein Leryth_027646 [Lithospermum erythrorhizon]
MWKLSPTTTASCLSSNSARSGLLRSSIPPLSFNNKKRAITIVAAVGDVSSSGTVYLIAGAATVALLGTAFPILFSRKDLKSGVTLRANAARKDESQIVCANCNGLGKINQIDK